MKILETKRCVVRELGVADAEFVLKLVNEPSFLKNIGDKGVRNLDDAVRFIVEGPWTNQPKAGYGQFAVELKDDGKPIGICGLLHREQLDLSDVGVALLPDFWQRGFAFEVTGAMIEYGRSKLEIPTIVGLTSPDNLASIKLLEKLGMGFAETVKMSDDDPGTALYRPV